jgi:hypothetical protein
MAPLIFALYLVCFLCTVIVSVSAVALSKITNVEENSVSDTSAVSPEVIGSPQKETEHVQDKDDSNATEEQVKADVVYVPQPEPSAPPETTYNDTDEMSSSRGESAQSQSRQEYF